MTFISRAARYVLRKRVRTAVLFIVLTIITASMLSATAVSQAAQHEAGQIEKQAVGGFVLASNLQGSMLTPRGGGMVRPADVQRISKLSGVATALQRRSGRRTRIVSGSCATIWRAWQLQSAKHERKDTRKVVRKA